MLQTLRNAFKVTEIRNTDLEKKHPELPLLMIDDEADNASLNTKKYEDATAQAICWRTPSFITTIMSEMLIASSWSCVTKIVVICVSLWILLISSRV